MKRQIQRKSILIISFCFLISLLSEAQQTDSINLKATIKVVSIRIEKEGPKSDYLKIRGWSYYCLGDYDQALKDFNLAIINSPSDPDLYLRRGDVKFEMGDYLSCIQDYSNAIKLSPDSLSYYTSRGVAYEKLQKNDKALEDYGHVLSLKKNDELTLTNRAILYSRKLSLYDKGINDWNRLLTINPSSSYYNDRGLTFMESGRYQEAIKDFSKAIELDNSDEKYFFNRGFCYGMTNKIKESFNDFSESEKRDKTNPYLYKYRGEIFLKIGQTDNACKDFKEANKLNLDVSSLLKTCRQ